MWINIAIQIFIITHLVAYILRILERKGVQNGDVGGKEATDNPT